MPIIIQASMICIWCAATALILAGCSKQNDDTTLLRTPEIHSVQTNSVSLRAANDGGRLTVALQNHRAAPVLIQTDFDDPLLSIRLFRKTGEFCSYTEYGRATMSVERLMRGGRSDKLRITPGETKEWTYDLRSGFQIGPAGKYLLEITAHSVAPSEINQSSFAINLGRVAISIKRP